MLAPAPQWIASGLTLGAVYALIALGFVMIYAITDVIKLAQGEFVMLGALVTVSLVRAKGPLLPAAVLAVALTMAAVGGLASVLGAVVGAAAVQLLIDRIRILLPAIQHGLHALVPAIPERPGGEQELIVFGLLLVAIMILLPGGIAGGANALARRRGVRVAPAVPASVAAGPEGEG